MTFDIAGIPTSAVGTSEASGRARGWENNVVLTRLAFGAVGFSVQG